jgi:acylphosphatase
MVKTVEIIITGRVQKVGFRACIRKIASDLNITGTVFNLSDGRVQIYATGDSIILEKFVSMIYGCPRAVIRDIRIIEIPFRAFEGFFIVKTEERISTEF